MRNRLLSVIVPVYNEEAVLSALIKRLGDSLSNLKGWYYEVIFVDDGSSDGSRSVLEQAVKQDSRLCLVCLSRNFGQQNAISAGLTYARGEAGIVLDADLQDPPEVLAEFIDRFDQGFDVVYAIRASRQEPWFMRLAYHYFYRILNAFSSIQIAPDSGDFALLSRRVMDALASMPEQHRFLRGLRAWSGYRQIGVKIERPGRLAGSSKYSAAKLFSLALDGILSFSIVPLRLATLLGVLAVASSMLVACVFIYLRLFHDIAPTGFTALFVAIVFMTGIQLLFLGVIGEYVGRIYEETKRRPSFLVERVVKQEDDGT